VSNGGVNYGGRGAVVLVGGSSISIGSGLSGLEIFSKLLSSPC